jgi:serine/threonine protein kinase
VTEYFEGYDLIDKVNRQIRLGAHLSEHQICHIMKQVLEAINYCHKTRICHRDIKAENILINDSDEIKIIDLGFADIVSTNEKNLSGYKGTKYCMAPEILYGNPYNEKCDIWSIAVVFYVLLAFSQPFKDTKDQVKGKYAPIELVKRSDLAFDLLNKMLNPNSDERISAS